MKEKKRERERQRETERQRERKKERKKGRKKERRKISVHIFSKMCLRASEKKEESGNKMVKMVCCEMGVVVVKANDWKVKRVRAESEWSLCYGSTFIISKMKIEGGGNWSRPT